ncbi:MAG: hypothetical protein HY899_12565 [Deltaproteobacteria bacterium]|nr:hypothetical protein [Deltaproteobacteria bacterium]
MKKIGLMLATVVLGSGLLVAAPASAADLCLQFAGATCDLSGDLGFFRFMAAKLPTTNKRVARLNGRACAYGTVTGSAVTVVDGTSVEIGATFICDGVPGVIEANFPLKPVVGTVSSGADATYGAYSLSTSCTATVVDCATEPGLP